MEKSKTSKCKRLEKLIATYLHMYKWDYYASRSILLSEKKNVKTLRNLLNLLHILSCALPICFSRNLLNLSNHCLLSSSSSSPFCYHLCLFLLLLCVPSFFERQLLQPLRLPLLGYFAGPRSAFLCLSHRLATCLWSSCLMNCRCYT